MLLTTTAPSSAPTSTAEAWRVRVSDEDVRQARDAWLRARHGGAPAERVRELRQDLERLWRARRSELGDALTSS